MTSRLDPVGYARSPLVLAAGLSLAAAFVVGTFTALADARLALAAVALAGALLVAAREQVALYLLVLVLWLNLSDVAITYHNAPSIDKLLIPLILITAVGRSWLRREPLRLDLPLIVALALYACSVALSAFVATDVSLVTYELVALAKNVVLVLTVTLLVRDTSHVRITVWALVIAGLILGVTSSVRWLVSPWTDTTFGGLARTMQAQIVGELDSIRLTGPLDDPNSFAQVLVPLVPLAWNRLLDERGVLVRAAAALALAAVLAALVGTYSRSGLLAMALTAALLALLWHRHRPILLVGGAALIICLLVAFLPRGYIDRATQLRSLSQSTEEQAPGGDVSLAGRRDEMYAALAMTIEHPVLGVGIGHYITYFQGYSNRLGLYPRQEDRQAHSLYLELLAERGVVGFTAFVGLCGMAARRAVRTAAALELTGRRVERRMVQAVLVSLVAYLVFAVVLHRGYEHYFWVLLGAVLAAARATPGSAVFGVMPAPQPSLSGRVRQTVSG